MSYKDQEAWIQKGIAPITTTNIDDHSEISTNKSVDFEDDVIAQTNNEEATPSHIPPQYYDKRTNQESYINPQEPLATEDT